MMSTSEIKDRLLGDYDQQSSSQCYLVPMISRGTKVQTVFGGMLQTSEGLQ